MSFSPQRIADDLRRRIEAKELKVDTKLPSEKELASRYGVSTPTLREALDTLQAEGRVEKQQGRGNFVREPNARMTYVGGRHLMPQTDRDINRARETGKATSMVEADTELAKFLNVPEGSMVTTFGFVGCEEDAPRTIAKVYVPTGVALVPSIQHPVSPWGDDVRNSLARAGVHVASTVERLTARRPTSEEAEILSIPSKAPVLEVERTSFDMGGNVVEGALLILRGDRNEAVYTTRAGVPFRLLPWDGPEGSPAYVSTDDGGHISDLADGIEASQMKSAASVLSCAKDVIEDKSVGADELRYVLNETAIALRDVLRIADSRGLRLPSPPLGLSGDGGLDEPAAPHALMAGRKQGPSAEDPTDAG
ncbi:GntR family transcriptional regulator [Streptomyces sp. UNOC14_S4]|uniref:GntR family transcriptional regulator n=1 Tax=Streptomyces sp. UNOC14_S4 TaxID=2872340 RepID=UPI001E51C25F|nr:GntR family transcriptional regulator [Streptomyces sp. UNOC14_S4]MCC3769392.1 GntR family transcriptional regulator [Streptomyces sp. UNOC14_S4]